MALDEPNNLDQEFEIDGFKYIVNKEFLERANPIKVDFHMYGFKLDCNIDFGPGCTSCGTGKTSCSC
jgi:iron-sulfur cluster assembly protein